MKAVLTERRATGPAEVGRGRRATQDAGAWPTAREWARRERALAERECRRLGVGPKAAAGLRASRVLEVLGPGSFAEFDAVRAAGRVVWCDFDLARRLGFDVPRSNRLTPGLEEQLLAACSLRSVARGDELAGGKVIKMYADRYGGAGLGPALGGGRAGFLARGNLYVKGVGHTPLFRHDNPDDFAHSHGAVHFDDCLVEAVFGAADENLFARGSAPVLAVIDQGRSVTAPDGRSIPVALVVRAGAQLRPGHLLARHERRHASRLEQFISLARATGQLVTRAAPQSDGELPDVRATMLRVIEDHARAAAESFRWRMVHGALTPSNMELSGAMLDLPTQSAQPRTAPIQTVFEPADSVYGREQVARSTHLNDVYRVLLRGTTTPERGRLNAAWINVAAEMRRAYDLRLQVELLRAAGLKEEVARRLRAERPELAAGFAGLLLRMAALRNPGTTRAWTSSAEHVSALDLFNLLGQFPKDFFAAPRADHAARVFGHLRPVFRGNRFHVARRRAAAEALAREFAALYRELMEACAAYAREFYGGADRMRASVEARAAFENRPLDALYFKELAAGLRRAVEEYRAGGDAEAVRREVGRRIEDSLRSVDGLLARGEARRLRGGGVELQMKTVEGVGYGVRAWDDPAQTRRLRVSVPVEADGELYRHGVAGLPPLTRRLIQTLRYRFTADGWRHSGEVGARLAREGRRGLFVVFEEIQDPPAVGRLEGFFRLARRGRKREAPAAPYHFAVPDRQELRRLVAGPFAD